MGTLQQAFLSVAPAGAPPTPGPGSIADLELWYDASQETGFSNGDEMSAIQDWSGNSRHGTGVVSLTKKPTYRSADGPLSGPCVRLVQNSDGVGGYFTAPNFLTGFPAGHAFSIFKLDLNPPVIISKCAPPLGDWGATTGDLFPFPTDVKIYDGFGATVRKGPTTTTIGNWGIWGIYEERSAAGAWSCRYNGGELFTTAVNTVGWTTAPKIGATATNSNRMEGLFKETFMYSRILDAGEYDVIKAYVLATSGITVA